MGALSDNIYHISKSHDDEMMEPEEFIKPNYLNDPLDIDHFNVTNEWLMHVPLPVQIFLEHTYISKVVTANNSIQIRPKVASVYCQFEAHLKNSESSILLNYSRYLH